MTELTDIALAAVLARVRCGTTTDDDAHWLQWHVIGLQSRLDRAEGELKGMREQLARNKEADDVRVGRGSVLLKRCNDLREAMVITGQDIQAAMERNLAQGEPTDDADI